MTEFAPGMRTIIRDEEWMVKKIETNSLGNKALHCVGISPLVKDREAIFLTDLEEIQIVNPADDPADGFDSTGTLKVGGAAVGGSAGDRKFIAGQAFTGYRAVTGDGGLKHQGAGAFSGEAADGFFAFSRSSA